jgi:hypothetical protein
MNKFRVFLTVIGSVVAGALLLPKEKIEKKQEVKIERIQTKKRKRKIVIVEEKPDGSKKTVIQEDTATDTGVQSLAQSEAINEVGKKNPTRISVLTGYSLDTQTLVYGASITKPVLGPVSIGVWALTNKTFGASVGVDL